MTTVWERGAPSAEWLAALQDQISRARRYLQENAAPGGAAPDQAGQALRQASDTLMVVLMEFGVDTPLGWRLHQLRNHLDAHLLAASALADADATDAVVSVLRRSLDFIGPELESLATVGSGS